MESNKDPYIGIVLNNGYKITEYVDSGKIGTIYKAEKKEIQLSSCLIPGTLLIKQREKEDLYFVQ